MTPDVKNFLGMKNNFKHSASVEQYLSGEMLPAERENFEREVASNPGLAAELRLSRAIDSALLKDDIIDFRKKILVANKENKKEQRDVPVVRLYARKIWYAAASFILLATLGSTLYFSVPSGNSTDNLFKQYYSSENLIDVTRAGDANIVEAVIKFQEKDYQLSARLFQKILEKDSDNIACWFYFGISSIETENFEQAEKAFNHIIADNENLYVEHAEWYLGLSYLKSNQLDKAHQQFETISKNADNVHQDDATRLIEKLK
jgi:tetratricopeptide (TPR) repeat protein